MVSSKKYIIWFIGFLLVFFFSGIVLAAKGDYLKYVDSKADITIAYTEYQICNPLITSKLVNDFDVNFIETKGKLNNVWGDPKPIR